MSPTSSCSLAGIAGIALGFLLGIVSAQGGPRDLEALSGGGVADGLSRLEAAQAEVVERLRTLEQRILPAALKGADGPAVRMEVPAGAGPGDPGAAARDEIVARLDALTAALEAVGTGPSPREAMLETMARLPRSASTAWGQVDRLGSLDLKVATTEVRYLTPDEVFARFGSPTRVTTSGARVDWEYRRIVDGKKTYTLTFGFENGRVVRFDRRLSG